MEGFKSNTKMQCYKEGGSVKYKSRNSEKAEEKHEEKKDIAKDVGMIKKGVKQHEEARHKGEPKTKLKLKAGGRSKVVGKYKAGGSVGKYQMGGNVTGAAQTEEEKARMKPGKLPQQVVDEEAMAANTETREMVAGPLRKLKRGIMEKFKSETKTPMKEGGSLKEVDSAENPGLAKLPTNVRNKMGYMRKGGKACR